MTPELREEAFGQIDGARLKALFDASPWCKSHINRSRNASDILIVDIIKRDQKQPCGSPLFACYYCFEMYEKDKFSMDQPEHAIRKPNGRYKPFNQKVKPESTSIEPLRRFCMPCGVRLHLHRRFRRFVSQTGLVWWVCRCWVLRPAPVADDGEPCPECDLICPLRNPEEEDATLESDESDESDT
ncbi:hypothetical protein CGCFRS4_v015297 [Colletotrichum fructicola]|nr:hypothetical protein CGCFRS4_v015297 [Colletotrichum fructicola]